MAWTTSLAIGAIGGSGGGAERGATDAVGIEELVPIGGGMLGAETRGATGAIDGAPACGTFGAIGAFGAMGAFALSGRKSEGATRTAGSAASGLPDGVFLDLAPASFAIRKF